MLLFSIPDPIFSHPNVKEKIVVWLHKTRLKVYNSSCFSLSKDGRVIVMSIHQPRYSIFRLCDHIILMSQGNIIYAGAGRATLPYFSDVLGKL